MQALFILAFFLSSYSSIHLNSKAQQISTADINRINEIFRIQSIAAKNVWPGFENADFKFVLIGQNYQWAVNVGF